MDFRLSERTTELLDELTDFVDHRVRPAEADYDAEVAERGHGIQPETMEELKGEARRRGLWNLFLPDPELGAGLSNLEYAPLAEVTGRSALAPEAVNCNAPDTGNMEILAMFGTPEQREQWLHPLLEGEIRSCFSMTEPDVASSDARNIQCRIERDGDEYLVNGRKWWSTNVLSERCRIAIVMGKSDPEAEPYRQQSMILVPLDTPGVRVERDLSVFGYHDNTGHGEIVFDDVRVPATNLLGSEGAGFEIAQARLGPGRIHHCMRTLGAAELALELLCERADEREPFGRPLSDQSLVQSWIADGRIAIEQARLWVLKTAWLMDTVGPKEARTEIAGIKVAVPRIALEVTDKAIQAHGGAGVSQDTPLARQYANLRTMRIVDGPDEVHQRTVARQELRRQRARRG